MAELNLRSAVKRIEQRGALLVFPLSNKKEPPSLWGEFYPRSQMRWEWDSGADHRVPNLWHLREQLSRSGKVVYTKWYRGRATFFSRPLFTSMLCSFFESLPAAGLGFESRGVLEILEENSPLSTKVLKKRVKMEGRYQESTYNKALKELWKRLLIVGFGEVDDGAFPSLAIGGTEALFNELWRQAASKNVQTAEKEIREILGESSLFFKDYLKLKTQAPKRPAGPLVFRPEWPE